MYTEDYENRGFPFRDFLLKLILIVIFVFLLVWLLPKFISPKVVENNNDGNSSNSEISREASQIFNENLNQMKDAAISYYTDERLPKEMGESYTMTLGEMIEKKIISELLDKNNKSCDINDSYVKITKADNEYILKVNLKDSFKEDYILVHLGCYTYCDTYVCEKEETQIIIKGEKPGATTITPTPSDEEEQEQEEPSDNPSETTPSDDINPEPLPTPAAKYEYEYKKTTGTEYSNWTAWSDWTKTSCDTKEINCSDSSVNCLKKLQLYTRKEKIGTYNRKYVTTKDEIVQTGSYSQTACSNYSYIIINSITYTTTNTYTVLNTITSSTASSKSDWKYNGRDSYNNPPQDTATTHYEFVGADYSNCEEACTSMPKFFYDSYTYIGTLNKVSSTTSTPSNSTTSSTPSTTVEASCDSYVTKTIPIYGTIKKSYIATRTEPLYGTVCYQSTKTRKIINNGKTQYKWSYYNDTSLLEAGWEYTGKKELVS